MGNSIISARIKETRIDKKLSQEELSEKSGLSLRTIQRLENGESVPRGDTLKRLTNALELPTNYFNNSLFENNDKGDNKNLLVVPWFLIGCFIICGSIGFILSIVLVMVNVIPYGEFGLPLLIAITLLFCGIGFVIGNYIEKKYRK
jgi:transcriptional regulator with XRE-family HTH domain